MSFFICAHGLLTCKCSFCSEFVQEKDEFEDSEQKDEEKEIVNTIIRTLKKEKIEY